MITGSSSLVHYILGNWESLPLQDVPKLVVTFQVEPSHDHFPTTPYPIFYLSEEVTNVISLRTGFSHKKLIYSNNPNSNYTLSGKNVEKTHRIHGPTEVCHTSQPSTKYLSSLNDFELASKLSLWSV